MVEMTGGLSEVHPGSVLTLLQLVCLYLILAYKYEWQALIRQIGRRGLAN